MDKPPIDIVSSYQPDVLEGAGSAEPRTVSLYCLLFHSRDTALDREVEDYVLNHQEALNEVFGPRLQGFAIKRPNPGEAKDDRDKIYEYARLYEVGVDQLPCAVFITAIDKRKALKLPFGAFLPPRAKRDSDDVALAFRAIATAADRTADVSERRRIASFHRSLRAARRDAYGDRIPSGSRALSRVACDADAINRIATSGRNVLALAGATAVFFGATTAVSGTSAAGPTGGPAEHAALTEIIDGADGHSVKHHKETPRRAAK